MELIYDCIIIGGGPAGLSAAINLTQRGKKALVLSAGDNLLHKAPRVDNYLGMPNLTGKEMMNSFTAHAQQQNVEIKTGMAANIYSSDDIFMVNFGGEIYTSKTIILASGVAKAKAVNGEEAFLGRGVSYCATCDGMLYRGKQVAVWGLTADAVNEANHLFEIGCLVTFISTKKPQALADDIKFISGRIDEIKGQAHVKNVIINGKEFLFDGVFILRNTIAPSSLMPGIDIQDGYVKINSRCETNVAGVFAAGDITGKPLQVSNAVGDGLIAALNASEYLDLKEI